jgi:uncharacterized protein (DUF433 family)
MGWRDRIESDTHAARGGLRVRGAGIPVSVVLDNLAEHVDLHEVLASYPSLSEEDVRACIAWAAECSHMIERVEGRKGVIDADFAWSMVSSPPPRTFTAMSSSPATRATSSARGCPC